MVIEISKTILRLPTIAITCQSKVSWEKKVSQLDITTSQDYDVVTGSVQEDGCVKPGADLAIRSPTLSAALSQAIL